MKYIIKTEKGFFDMSKEEFELALCVYEFDFNWTFHTDDPSIWNPNNEKISGIPDSCECTYKYLTPWIKYPVENLRTLKQKVKFLEGLGVKSISTYWDADEGYLTVWGYDKDDFPIKTWWSHDFHDNEASI